MQNWHYVALVFAAVTLASAIVVKLFIQILQERAELDESQRMMEIGRFVDLRRLLALRVLLSLAAFSAMFILELMFGVERMVIAVPVAVAFGLASWRMVLMWYCRKVAKRREAFESKILDLTMGLANGMKSGLALGQALDAVSRRIGDPMREEISTLLREVRFGVDVPTAFENLARRMPCEDIHLLTTSVALTTRSGGSLADVLDEMSDTIRKRTEFDERLRSMTAQGRYEALVISLAPLAAFAIFYLIDPVLMRPLVQTGIGWSAIGVAAALIYAGYRILLRITNVEV